MAEKTNLGEDFIRRKYIKEDEEEKSNSDPSYIHKTPSKPEKLDIPLIEAEKGKILSTNAKSHPKRQQDEESEFNRHSGKMESEVRSERSSYSVEVMPAYDVEEEERSSSKHHRYIVFYKYYYRKLSREHPRWNAAKISYLIKLLWKKQQKCKATKIKKITEFKSKSIKKMTGYFLYKRQKLREGGTPREIYKHWKPLPTETKNMFKQREQGYVGSPKLMFERLVMRLKSSCGGYSMQYCPAVL